MQKNISRVTELKLNDSLTTKEQEELNKLKIFFENSVDSNFIYNRAYFNFLKFLKENEDIEFAEYENMSDEKMDELMEKYKDLF